jgi:hypothetical protein
LASAANWLLSGRYFSSTPIICSSSAIDLRTFGVIGAKSESRGITMQLDQTESLFAINDGITIRFKSYYHSPDNLLFYDFADVVTNTTRTTLPVVYVDNSLLSKLDELSLIETFARALSKLITFCGHDYIHSLVNRDLEIHRKRQNLGRSVYPSDFDTESLKLAASLFSSDSLRNEFVPEEVLAFSLNNAVYQRIKRPLSQELAAAAKEVYDIANHDELINNPDAQIRSAAANCIELVKILLSNYTQRDVMGDTPDEWLDSLQIMPASDIFDYVKVASANGKSAGNTVRCTDFIYQMQKAMESDIEKAGKTVELQKTLKAISAVQVPAIAA